MAELLHIFVKPNEGSGQKDVEKQISKAVDWFRVSDEVYIVYTTSEAKKWNVRLKSVVRPGGYCLITPMNPEEFSGWMPKKFWTWLDEKKGKLGYE